MATEDAELLRQYAEAGSESAFAELVERRLNLVYSVAFRASGGDVLLAQDIAQHVFIELGQKADALRQHPALAAWLYRTAQFTAIDFVRSEHRRRYREKQAHAMNANSSVQVSGWEESARPLVDEALAALGDDDHNAVVLRVIDDASYQDIGRRLNVSENTARMRVTRALDRIRSQLAERGITSTAAALTACVAGQASVAAPAGLATAISSAALGAVPAATVALPFIMATYKTATAATAAIVLLLAGGIALQEKRIGDLTRQLQAMPPPAAQPSNSVLSTRRAEVAALRPAQERLVTLQQDNQRLKQDIAVAERATPQTEPWTQAPVVPSSQLSAYPKILKQARPNLPPEQLSQLLQGRTISATVRFIVDIDGHARIPRVTNEVDPIIAAAATEAVGGWEFSPPQLGAEAVNTEMAVDIVFAEPKDPNGTSSPPVRPPPAIPWF